MVHQRKLLSSRPMDWGMKKDRYKRVEHLLNLVYVSLHKGAADKEGKC